MQSTPGLLALGLLALALSSCDPGAEQRAAKEQELQQKEAELDRREQALQRRAAGQPQTEGSAKAAGPTTALAVLMQSAADQAVPVSRFTAALGEPTRFERADFEQQPSGAGNSYYWELPTGLHVAAYSGGEGPRPNPNDGVMFLSLTPAGKQPVAQLPYGLTLNQTTKAECEQQFGAELQCSEAYDDGRGIDSQCKIHRDGVYTYLYFDKAGKLVEIQHAGSDLDAAG